MQDSVFLWSPIVPGFSNICQEFCEIFLRMVSELLMVSLLFCRQYWITCAMQPFYHPRVDTVANKGNAVDCWPNLNPYLMHSTIASDGVFYALYYHCLTGPFVSWLVPVAGLVDFGRVPCSHFLCSQQLGVNPVNLQSPRAVNASAESAVIRFGLINARSIK